MGWSCFKSKQYVHISQQEPKTVHIVFGFFFIINYIVGTGFLGIPYSFYEAGMLAGIVTLIVISFIAWNTASWELEVMARAQVCFKISALCVYVTYDVCMCVRLRQCM